MIETLPETTRISTTLLVILIGVAGIFTIVTSLFLPRLIGFLLRRFISPQAKDIYETIVLPYQGWLILVIALAIADLVVLFSPNPEWFNVVETSLGLTVTVAISWLGSRLFRDFFEKYLLSIALEGGRKLNSELLIVAKFLGSTVFVIVVIFVFAQVHSINVFGLIASLGIGGLAVAFAAQKTLEQLLGGIVLYLDRPFVVDDYIGLPDGTFGKVESIGLRSTKIRTSGKGTLTVVPNSSLTQMNIENFTGAKKVISIIYLTFYRHIAEQEKALIRQVILDSTSDIFGIDARSTEVKFKDIMSDQETEITQAQINFFILGSGEVSMDLRRQLLEVANQNINQQLKEYGIAFDIEDKMINVDAPITI